MNLVYFCIPRAINQYLACSKLLVKYIIIINVIIQKFFFYFTQKQTETLKECAPPIKYKSLDIKRKMN